jgi:hypothetical protein
MASTLPAPADELANFSTRTSDNYLIIMMRSLFLPLLLSLPLSLVLVDTNAALMAQTPESARPGTVGVERLNTNRTGTGRRVALVIGNANYQIGPLRNPGNDARAMNHALRQLGFQVILVTDANLRQMEAALDRFTEAIEQGGVGVFYYAGHGIQSGGENYLIPVDANLRVEQDLRHKTLPLGLVLGRMQAADNGVNIVILDACRDNPLPRRWRSGQRGLAEVRAEEARGIHIEFAAEPGNVAADGDGQNGTFTAALLRYIRTPHESVEQLFKRVRQRVSRETNERQTPTSTTSMIGDFSFYNPRRSVQPAPNLPVNPLLPSEEESELLPDLPESIPCLGSVCAGLPQ